jgi:hypothetical protein
MSTAPAKPQHPRVSRRVAIQAGAIGLLGLGMNHLGPLRAAAAPGVAVRREAKARSVIYIFLSGGLAQHESFDMKPEAPSEIRGEFKPVPTRTPGLHICEHLPELAKRSELWAICRSLTHPYNEHSQGHMVMLSGRTEMPRGFDASKPKDSDWPSIAAVANEALRPRNNLPPVIVLPEKLVHNSGRVIPGQFAGQIGAMRNPFFLEAAPFDPKGYGAFPEFYFHHNKGRMECPNRFQAPNLSLPEGLTAKNFGDRLSLFRELNAQRDALQKAAEIEGFDRQRQMAVSLLSDAKTQAAFDVAKADGKTLDRYGRNSFGWSLLMARQLVEAGVDLVQVNLGNDETWDTHEAAFPNLKNFLLPPMDRAVSALLDDLKDRSMLDRTMIVMAGEFGRTPKITTLPSAKLPGRDHWGMVQSVFFAGGGVQGGAVIGSSDKNGGYPASDPQTPENFAATIYDALGIPPTAAWHDELLRPHHIYHGQPIPGLVS